MLSACNGKNQPVAKASQGNGPLGRRVTGVPGRKNFLQNAETFQQSEQSWLRGAALEVFKIYL